MKGHGHRYGHQVRLTIDHHSHHTVRRCVGAQKESIPAFHLKKSEIMRNPISCRSPPTHAATMRRPLRSVAKILGYSCDMIIWVEAVQKCSCATEILLVSQSRPTSYWHR